MLRNLSCLCLSLVCYLLSSTVAFSQNIENQVSTSKFTFTLDHKSIQHEIILDQKLTLPTYKITLNSRPSIKECVSLKCDKSKFKDKHVSKNQTWDGFFLPNQRFNQSLSKSEMAYRLSGNIKGLDPILAQSIINQNILEKIKLKKRPKDWIEFSKFIRKIQNELDELKINFNLYNQVINVYGYENGLNLDYYKEEYCFKTVTDCDADQLDIRKELVNVEYRNVTINYQKLISSNVFLFDNEVDSFDIVVSADATQPQIISKAKHNNYLISVDQNSTPENIVVIIVAVNRKEVPLEDNFVNLFANSYFNGIFFEWRLSSNQLNSMLLAEKQNITIEYQLCEMTLFFCGKKIRTKRFNLSTVGLPNKVSANEVLVQRLTLGKDDLKINKTYQMTYKIYVEGSSKISAPVKFKKRIRIQYLPY